MKLLIILALVGFVVARPYEILEYDKQAYKEALENPRLLSGYGDCILGKGPCTSEGKKLKQLLPELVNTSCAKCTEDEKGYAGKAIVAFKKNFVDKYEEIKKIYDPDGKRDAELIEFESKYGS